MKNEDFEKVYNQYNKVLYFYSLRIVSEENVAEDIVHDVFCEYWARRKTIDLNLPIKSYLYTAVRNKSFDFLKSSYHKTKKFDATDEYLEEYVYSIINTEDNLNAKELSAELTIAINNLPERCREVFLLSRNNDLKNREVADKLNIHLKTVEKHISKAISDIKQHLEKNGYLNLLLIFFWF